MDPTRVVLDCDTANEVDDQFAIANALGVPEGTLDVRGVISLHNTTAHGPGSRDMYQEEAERVVPASWKPWPAIHLERFALQTLATGIRFQELSANSPNRQPTIAL